MTENVNHPKHYNQHPNGIECIDVIRHYACDIANAIKYLWRAGLKQDADKSERDKEIEDLRKALWYIEDYRVRIPQIQMRHFKTFTHMMMIVEEVTGYQIDKVTSGYKSDDVATAIGHLMVIGIIRRGDVCVSKRWEQDVCIATESIEKRINEL